VANRGVALNLAKLAASVRELDGSHTSAMDRDVNSSNAFRQSGVSIVHAAGMRP